MTRWVAWAILVVALLPLAGHAAEAPPGAPAKERERIRVERAAVEQRYQSALTACGDRFVVTACTDAARAERRAAMERLAREQGVLDDAERRDRAAQRMRRIEDKMREVDQRSEAPAPPARAASVARPAPPRHITRATPAAPRASEAGDRDAAARAVAAQRRAREAQAHREAVEQRNAERAARKPPAAGLPVPAASAP